MGDIDAAKPSWRAAPSFGAIRDVLEGCGTATLGEGRAF